MTQQITLIQEALCKANENKTILVMDFMGIPSLIADIAVFVQDFEQFDGNYFVTSVKYKPSPA